VEGELQHRVGTNLRRARESRGLSQEQFGEAIGRHRTAVSAIECGKQNLTLASLERLAADAGLAVDDLLAPVPPEVTARRGPAPGPPPGAGVPTTPR
jgi:transcriptional regulator with XRE-family HTH domain